MKDKIIYILVCMVIMQLGCSSPTEEYELKVAERLKKDAEGIELNYESLDFRWVDTLTISKRIAQLESLTDEFREHLSASIENERESAIDYYESRIEDYQNDIEQTKTRTFAFLKDQVPTYQKRIEYYDSLKNAFIKGYDSGIEDDKILAAYNARKSINYFYGFSRTGSGKYNDVLFNYETALAEWVKINSNIDSLMQINQDQVIHYEALNKYTIINPFVNNAKQELTKRVFFNPSFEVIGITEPKDD